MSADSTQGASTGPGSELNPGEYDHYPKLNGGKGLWIYKDENGTLTHSDVQPNQGKLASGGKNAQANCANHNASCGRVVTEKVNYGIRPDTEEERDIKELYALEKEEKELEALEEEINKTTIGGTLKELIIPQDTMDVLLSMGGGLKIFGKSSKLVKLWNKAEALADVGKLRKALKAKIDAKRAKLAKNDGKTSVKQKNEAKADKECKSCPGKGSPVNPIYGSKVLEGDADLDFVLDGPLPFAWQRTYISDNANVGWLGQGWSLPIAFHLDIEDDAVVFVDVQGRRTPFPQLAVGQQYFSLYEHTTLKRTGRNTYEVISPDGLRLVFGLTGPQLAEAVRQDAAEAEASKSAKEATSAATQLNAKPNRSLPQADKLMLSGMIDLNENVIKLVWSINGLPHHLIDSTGRKIGFYFKDNRLAQVYEMHGEPDRKGLYAQSQLQLIVEYQYSSQGDLTAVIDSAGATVRTFAWQNHMMVEHAEPDGIVSRYEWDQFNPKGRVTRNTVSTGEFWEFTYAEAIGQTIVNDASGRRTIYHYDANKRFTGITDPAGNLTTRKLDLYGNLIALIDAAGNRTSYQYDEQCNLLSIKQADGATTTLVHHPQWRKPISITNALGQTTRFTYDERGNLISQIGHDGAATHYRLNARGLPVEVIDARGGVVTLDYDDASRLIGYTDCSGNRTDYQYNKRGNLAAVTDAQGGSIYYAYERINRQDRLSSILRSDGMEERMAYDKLGRLIAHHDPLGQVTHYKWDAASRMVMRQNALGHTLRYGYDVHGRLTVLHNENDAKARFAYDVLDQLIAEQGFDGRRIDYRYNIIGHLVESIEGSTTLRPIRTRHRRDKMGRLLAKISVKRKEPTERGGPSLVTARNRYRYNELGQLTQARNQAAEIELHYNPIGQLLREITRIRNGPVSALEHGYDLLGNRIRTTLPDGRQLNSLTYGSGHVHQINLDGEVIADFERNKLHAEISRTQGALTSHYQRDGLGRLLSSRTDSTAPELPAKAPLVGATRMHVALPQGPTGRAIARRYEYDQGGQLRQINDARAGSIGYRYDPIGRLLAAQQGQHREDFAFDPAHNLLDPDDPNQGKPKPKKTSFTQEEWAALVKANIDNPKFNPLQALDDYNNPDNWNDVKANQIKVHQDKRYAYDEYGNTLEKKIGAHTVQHYAWDAEHQLIQATVVRQGVSQTFRYDYDPFGRRIAKHDSFGTTYFTWDRNRLLIEQRGQQQRLYVYEGNSFIPLAQVTLDQTPQDLPELEEEIPPIPHEWFGMMNMYPPEWKKRMKMEGITPAQLAQEEAEKKEEARQEILKQRKEKNQQAVLDIYYYHTDHLGTPRELTDKKGDIRWSATYKAWGNTLKVEVFEEETAAVPIEQALRYQGQYFDAETGLHYNRHRYYDPDIGRFLSQDPIGLGGGENFYQYAPNPVQWIDPLGLAGKTVYQKNWEEMYGPLPKGYEVHHIIPKNAKSVAAAKKLCKNFDEHHVSNLIALPSNDAPKPWKSGLAFGSQLHDGYHAGYNRAALHALKAADKLKIAGVSGCAKLAAIQMSLREKLTVGDLSMYKGPGDATADAVKKNWVDYLKFDLFN